MLATLRYIGKAKPRTGFIENVMGLTHTSEGCDCSPKELVEQTLQGHGYATSTVRMCLSTWHSCVRQRIGDCWVTE